MATPMIPTTVTLDELDTMRATFPQRAFVATSDAGGWFDMIAPGWAIGSVTGQIVRVVRTGVTPRNEQVRVRIEFGRDLSLADGSMVFGDSGHTGGWARPEAL